MSNFWGSGQTFTLYISQVLSKEQTIESLKVKKLYDQLVFTSKKALDYLHFTSVVDEEEIYGSEKI